MESKFKIVLRYINFFLIGSIICSCSGKKKEDLPTYYLGQNFKDYNSFGIGSYWIYENSVSGAIDSIYLFDKSIEIVNGKNKLSFNYEFLSQKLKSSFYNDTILGAGESLNGTDPPVYQEAYLKKYSLVNIIYAELNNVGEIFSYNPEIKTRYKSYWDTTLVVGTKYYKVKEFEVLQQMDLILPQRIFYSKHIGVIRKELWNGEVWNLKKYHINN